jgi:2-oxo-4-hydroxy-4-carboxy-5-ureidoimidazoline decarboxylase
VTLDQLNAITEDDARRELARCCGSDRWTTMMLIRRPFQSAGDLYQAADETWWSLGKRDWLEAFGHHPRIGARAAGWAGDEQSGVSGASDVTLKALTGLNREYERRFGHVFLICATGRSASEMLAELQRRLANAPDEELRIAAGEQAKITRLRLEKLLTSSLEPSGTA